MAGVRAAAPIAKEAVAASPTRVFNMSVLLKNGGLIGAASHTGARLVLPFCAHLRSLCFGGSVVIAAASSHLRRSDSDRPGQKSPKPDGRNAQSRRRIAAVAGGACPRHSRDDFGRADLLDSTRS